MARLSLAALALGLSLTSAAGADPILVDAVVARVDGHPILLSSLRARLRQLDMHFGPRAHVGDEHSRIEQLSWRKRARGGGSEPRLGAKPARRDPSAEIASARRALLDSAIDELLVKARARQLSIRITAAELQAALAGVAEQNGYDVPELMRQVALAGVSEEDYRAELGRQLLQQRVLLVELNQRSVRWDAKTSAAWWADRHRELLHRLRRNACIERRMRF